MDRNVISCFFLLFLSITLSSARIPFDSTDIDDINFNDIIIDHTNLDSSVPLLSKEKINPSTVVDDNSILLPSDKPEPEPKPKPAETLIQSEPEETAGSKKEVPIATSTESSEATNYHPHPFTVFSIEPLRIPRRPLPLSYRPVHRCYHNHHHYKPWNNRHFPRRGNHVITNINVDVDEKDFDRVARGGGGMRFGHVNEPMFFRERSMAMEKSDLLRRLYHRRYHQRRQQQEPAAEIKDTTGLVKRIRKFLNRF